MMFRSKMENALAENRKALMAVKAGDLLRWGCGNDGVNGGLRLVVEGPEKQSTTMFLTRTPGHDEERDPINALSQNLTEIIHRNDQEWPIAILEFCKVDLPVARVQE